MDSIRLLEVVRGWLQRRPFYVTIRLAELHKAARVRGSVLRTVFLLPSEVEVNGCAYRVFIEGGKQARVWFVREDVADLVVPEGVEPIERYKERLRSTRPGAIIAKAALNRAG